MCRSSPIWALAICIFLQGVSQFASAAVIFSESFESPVVGAGGSTFALTAGWVNYSGPSTTRLISRPAGTSMFNSTGPLASPASGSQLLVLQGTNSGVYRMSGSIILPDTVFTLSAALGNSLASTLDGDWSLQLWADANNNNQMDAGDSFLAQQFGSNGTATNAAGGEWALNSVSFDSGLNPSYNGMQLIVFLNNYGTASSQSYYDSVLLESVPEPSRLLLTCAALQLVVLRRRRERA